MRGGLFESARGAAVPRSFPSLTPPARARRPTMRRLYIENIEVSPVPIIEKVRVATPPPPRPRV